MKANIKKQIARNIRDLFSIGDCTPALDRESGEEVGTLLITGITRDEIQGTLEGQAFGWEGQRATFRVPDLTQRGGNLRISCRLLAA